MLVANAFTPRSSGLLVLIVACSLEPARTSTDSMFHVDSPTVISLEMVFFDAESAALRPEDQERIQGYGVALRSPYTSVRIEGYADVAEQDAEALARARAEGVRDALVSHGADGKRLEAVGMAASEPMLYGETEEIRRWNRRVRFDPAVIGAPER